MTRVVELSAIVAFGYYGEVGEHIPSSIVIRHSIIVIRFFNDSFSIAVIAFQASDRADT